MKRTSATSTRARPDGKRGVNERQIVWKYYDHVFNPATAALLARTRRAGPRVRDGRRPRDGAGAEHPRA